MTYEIHITRNPEMTENGPAIALAEWIEAVTQADTCRLADGDYLVTLPENGQVFRSPTLAAIRKSCSQSTAHGDASSTGMLGISASSHRGLRQ
jgi:hypothetical protein